MTAPLHVPLNGAGIPSWATGTVFAQYTVVVQSGKLYQAQVAHTAGASFAADLGAGRWVQLDAEVDATALAGLGTHAALTTAAHGGIVASSTVGQPNGVAPLDGTGRVPSSMVGSTSDATTSSKGVVQLAGDLKGSASSPQVVGRKRVIDPSDYGTVDTSGVANSWTAVKAAWDAAIAAAASGAAAEIQLPGGTILLDNAAFSRGLLLPANIVGSITIRGQGRSQTTVRLSSNTRCFVSDDGTTGLATYIQNFTMEDLTVDCANQAGSGGNAQSVVLDIVGKKNAQDITIRRVNSKNNGPLRTSAWRQAIGITIYSATADSNDAYTVKRITIDSCRFGVSGGGGNIGVVLQALNSDSGTFGSGDAFQGRHRAYVYFDEIVCRDCWWDSGTVISTTFTGVGFMFGGYGYGDRLRVENCYAANSPDDLFEIGAFTDFEVRNCVAVNGTSELFYFRPMGVIEGGAAKANGRFIGCTGIMASMMCNAAFLVHSTAGVPVGHVTFENCVSRIDGASTPVRTLKSGLRVEAAFESITVCNFRRMVRGWSQLLTANGQSVTGFAASVSGQGGRGRLIIDGLHDDVEGTFAGSAFTGALITPRALVLECLSDAQVDVRNVTTRYMIAKTGNGQPKPTLVYITDGRVHQDAFASDTWARTDYVVDSGTASDLAVTGGALGSSANHGVEKVARWMGSSADFDGQAYGPLTDGGIWAKFLYSQTAGHKGGVIAKASSATTRLEAYLTDDGTNTVFNLDKVVDGARTNLQTQTLGARYADATAYWVRLYTKANVVTADYFIAAPATNDPTAAGAVTLTATLTTTDIKRLGQSAQGWCGFAWVPGVATATIDDLTILRMSVLRGKFSLMTHRDVDSTFMTGGNLYGIDCDATVGNTRIPALVVEDCDFASPAAGLNGTDFSNLLTRFGSTVVTRRIVRSSVPAPAAITVTASPFTYTNTDGYEEDVSIYAGTVSVISVTRPGGTASQVAAATGTVLRLAPGDAITVTYSVAPTIRKTPVL